MRWACILLPQLAMDGVLRGREDADAPLVLLSGTPQRRVLQAVTPSARALGLRPGQTLTAAQSLNYAFTSAEYDPTDIERWRNLLAAWAYGFSSQVSLHYPRCLLMEVESSLTLFGPWPRFVARLRDELTALGFRHRITLAHNPAAARMLANVQDGLAVTDEQALRQQIANMPLDRIGLSPDLVTALTRMGLRQMRQLQALPRDSLARRFPAELLGQLDTLMGLRPLALDYYRPPDVFDTKMELHFEAESTQALLFPLHRLTADLAAYLAGRDCGVQRFMLHLEHRDGDDSLLPVGLLSAEREAGMLLEFTRGRLEQLQLPSPVQAIRLVARDLPAFVPQHKALFEDRPQQSMGWEQLRERLRARLGDDSVQDLSAHADHRPEKAWRTEAASNPMVVQGGARPSWLLPEPQALRETGLRIISGPERIESGWWDGEDVRRDYYLIETRSGQRGWAFRNVGEDSPLQLHGWFA